MSHRRSPSFLVAALAALSGSVASAGSVTLTSVADNTLYQSDLGNISNGAGTAMFAGTSASLASNIRRAVLRFDVAAGVPAGATITSASLVLNENGSNFDEYVCKVYRVLASWGEGASVATGGQGGGTLAQTGDATWFRRFFPATNWTNAGGDFSTTESASLAIGAGAAFTWTSAQLASDVQDMLNNPATNFGWLIQGEETSSKTAKRFATREDATPDLRPALIIEFSTGCTGDLNGDTFVDDSDFVLFANAYNILDCADPAMPAGCPADLNADLFVDDSDFVLFASAYNDLICP